MISLIIPIRSLRLARGSHPLLYLSTMPQKQSNSVTKRKASSDDEDQGESMKKSKTADPEIGASGQPTNKVLPVTIKFPARVQGATLRLATWNICGLASSQKKVREFASSGL